MALPRVNTPNYSLELPSTGKTIKYRPFLVKEQKILLMAQDSGNEDEVADAMGKLVASCTYGDIDPDTSPMFDLEYVFLNIRCKSVGSQVKVVITCPDDEETKVPVTIDLEEINVNMLDNHSTEIMITDEVKANFRYPILKDMRGVTTDSTDRASTIDVKIVQRVSAAGVVTAQSYEEGTQWGSFDTSDSVRFLNSSGVVTESSAVAAFTPATAIDLYDAQQ